MTNLYEVTNAKKLGINVPRGRILGVKAKDMLQAEALIQKRLAPGSFRLKLVYKDCHPVTEGHPAVAFYHRPKPMEYEIDCGEDGMYTFTRKGKKRAALPEDEYGTREVLVNGEVLAADGTRYDAILLIDETSSGEHCGTWIMGDNYLVEQGADGFLETLGKTKEEFFPYRYRYSVALHCHDHHMDDDGWSR